ncbi:MAG: VanW family protein [Deltaproteobacteria bacterium]|nr:VanW family protein [Deltaproteobacteria bacterium]
MLLRPTWIPRPLSTYHPLLHWLAVRFRRLERWIEWHLDGSRYCHQTRLEPLPHRVKKHQSVLIRKLGPAADALQHNKVDNLRIVIRAIDGILIRPGETFSFCRLVGRPTARRGFKVGMELSRGVARPGIGGGICQASNLIFWLALHSPLEVVERHHHSFDPFPDSHRVLPFASGATVMYNYKDLRLRNNTPHTFQLRLWLDEKCLNGDLRCSQALARSYSVYEQGHRFVERGDRLYRSNHLWRKVICKRTGEIIAREPLFANFAEVKYRLRSGP